MDRDEKTLNIIFFNKSIVHFYPCLENNPESFHSLWQYHTSAIYQQNVEGDKITSSLSKILEIVEIVKKVKHQSIEGCPFSRSFEFNCRSPSVGKNLTHRMVSEQSGIK